MNAKTLLIDYGMGNLRSVANAITALGGDVRIASDPASLASAERIILPGVGAFGEAMARLRTSGLADALTHEVCVNRKPFLGICLGMQVLAQRGFEHGEHRGLGWIPGECRRISPGADSLRVPHIGWNEVRVHRADPLFADLPTSPTFYFVHSYHLVTHDADLVAGTSDYGCEMVVAVARGNILGTQFHPEKSHRAGLALLANFLRFRPWD